MAEYIVARRASDSFSVSKFDKGDQPLDTYEVDYTKVIRFRDGRPLSRCNCMAWRSGKTRPCKHIDMVAAFIQQGEPVGHSYPDPRSK